MNVVIHSYPDTISGGKAVHMLLNVAELYCDLKRHQATTLNFKKHHKVR